MALQWSAAWSSAVVVVCAADSGQGAIFGQKTRKFIQGVGNSADITTWTQIFLQVHILCAVNLVPLMELCLWKKQAWLDSMEWASELIGWRPRSWLFSVAVQLP